MPISNNLSRQIVSYLKNLLILTMQNVNFLWLSFNETFMNCENIIP